MGELRKALQQQQQPASAGLASGSRERERAGDDSAETTLVRIDGREVNFEYLKNVILKYMTCRSSESRHLLKVIATLLQFTSQEEAAVRSYLASKSWFGSGATA